MTEKRHLQLIPDDKRGSRPVLKIGPDVPPDMPLLAPEGGGGPDIEWVCGSCERILIRGLTSRHVQLQDVLIQCQCGAYNDATI